MARKFILRQCTIVLAILNLAAFAWASPALAADYYVDAKSGRDSAAGTSPESAFRTLERLMQVGLNPGDTVSLKRGGAWTGDWAGLKIEQAGAPDRPIVFKAHGEGPRPEISASREGGVGIEINAPWIVIEGLAVTEAQETGIHVKEKSGHVVIRDCDIFKVGVGVWLDASHCRVVNNRIHDLRMVVDTPGGDDDYGAVGVWLAGSDNEIAYNRFLNCRAASHDYRFDGGAVEFYGAAREVSRNAVHHNWAEGCEGFFELGGRGRLMSDNRIYYNVSYNNRVFFDIHLSGAFAARIDKMRIENNTIVENRAMDQAEAYAVGIDGPTAPNQLYLRNNLFYLKNYKSVFQGGKESGSFTHANNLYFLQPGGSLGLTAGPTEKTADPGFADVNAANFHLTRTSPAVDLGAPLKYEKDFDGQPVPNGKAPDAGAFEFRESAPKGG